jgi:hypothetical protein
MNFMNQRATESKFCYVCVVSIRMSVVPKCGWKWKDSNKAISKTNSIVSIEKLSSLSVKSNSVFSENEKNFRKKMCFAFNFSVLSYYDFNVSCNLRMANGLDTSLVLK